MSTSNKSSASLKSTSQRIEYLKHSYASYISHISKCIIAIETLVHSETSDENVVKITALSSALEKHFDKFKERLHEYKTLNMNDQNSIDKANEIYDTQVSRICHIKSAIDNFKQRNIETQVNLSQKPSSKTASKASTRSSLREKRLETEKAKLIAAQSQSRYENKMKLLQMQKTVELEEHKQKEFEKVLAAQEKLKLAELEEKFEKDSSYKKGTSQFDLESITSSQKVEHYLENNFDENIQKEINSTNKEFPLKQEQPFVSNDLFYKETPFKNQSQSFSTKAKNCDIKEIDCHSSSSSNHYEAMDSFIDKLIEGKETVLDVKANQSLSIAEALQKELDTRSLPPVHLLSFNGDSSTWPEFIENFKMRVHLKSSFTDQMRIERLLSVLKGEAFKSVESIGQSGMFYPAVLKSLKRDFGNPYLVSYLKLKLVFEKPQIKFNDRISLRQYHQQIKCNNTWLISIGYQSVLNSPENLTKAVKRLPNSLRHSFYRDSKNIIETEQISLLQFEHWLGKRLKEYFNPIANIIASQETLGSRINNFNAHRRPPDYQNNSYTDGKELSTKVKCFYCTNNHKLTNCEQFIKLTLSDKRKFVNQRSLCWNCLSNNHTIRECKSELACRKPNCTKRHHTLLHYEVSPEHHTNPPPNVSASDKLPPGSSMSGNQIKSTDHKTFLQIIPVVISNGNQKVKTNALLDTGSDSTTIRQDIAKLLNLKGQSRTLAVNNALLDSTSFQSKIVNFDISSTDHPNHIRIKNAFVVPHLNVTNEQFDINHLKSTYHHLRETNIQTLNDSDVTIIIGTDCPHLLVNYEFKCGNDDTQPYAVRTKLGWVLMGGDSKQKSINSNFIETNLEHFWEVENYAVLNKNHPSLMTKDEKRANSILEKATKTVNGNYEIGLLWQSDFPKLPYNRHLAVKRLETLERKLSRDPKLSEKYSAVINQYVELGHAKELTNLEAKTRSDITNYIPHHCVINPNKPGKLRVVFDAAAKFQNQSLNDHLLKGPDLLNNLVTLLMRFRGGEFAASADVEQMFHQIFVNLTDRDALRFVWRNSVFEDPKDYIMNVHLFGKNDSPCVANYALKRTAQDFDPNIKPHILDAIENDFYMDDFLKSDSSCDSLLTICKTVTQTLSNANFRLRKWISNNQEILDSFPATERLFEKSLATLSDKESNHRTLGILWNIKSDSLKLNFEPKNYVETKRGILSLLCSIFDPLGFIAPCLIEPKLIIQETWKLKLDWDQPLTEDLRNRFKTWISELSHLPAVEIDRYYNLDIRNDSLELHIFADSSNLAYGAVAYFRIKQNNKFTVSFVIGKSRLAPLHNKSLTIPKLELQAALMAVRLKVKLVEEGNFAPNSIYFWSDSKTVLKYIANENKRFPVFVTHRVNEIRLNSNISDWHFVPGYLNPADDCTRPMTLKTFLEQDRYLKGPLFLKESISEILQENVINDITEDSNETLIVNATSNKTVKEVFNWSRFSNYSKLLCHIVHLKLFVRIWQSKRLRSSSKTLPKLTKDLFNESEQLIIKLIQQECFSNEIEQLSQNLVIKSSCLISLCPVYTEGLLKVGGRLKFSDINVASKHQIILPYDHYVTNLIIQSFHQNNHHVGRTQVLATIRQTFWIVKGMSNVRKVLNKCLPCKKVNCQPKNQLMSDLPSDRLLINEPPFSATGIDYFGPIEVKRSRRTRTNTGRVKRYGVVFTCLTTRAVHLELAGDMSSDCFILALRRFIARRGIPKTLWSDNGSNFVGANNELHKLISKLDVNKINNYLVDKMTWKFIPPSSPWMGGAWESVVKIAKRALLTVTKERAVYEESLTTFLTEVECTLNSRPLISLTDDINDLEVLTPNHFLVGRQHCNYSAGDDLASINLRSRWKSVVALSNMFWSRFVKEYVPTLHNRKKWCKDERSFKVNDIVLVRTENVKRSHWPLGRIIETNESKDGRIRSVKVKMAHTTLVRPSNSLCLLEASS